MPKVSIIVPVYNSEKYLRQCLDSIVNQSLKDIEILCIDDGSTDSSLDILKEYEKQDKRIRIFSKPNAGYGHSMNMGLDNLTGDYVGLVDSDDCIAADMYECLYEKATVHDLDFVRSDHYRWFPTRECRKLEYCYATSDLYRTVINPFESEDLFVRVVTCTGIYKTSFIRENNIRYNETPGAAFQDQGFWFQTTALAKRIMFVNQAFYYYRFDNEDSSINSNKAIVTMDNEYGLIKKFVDSHLDVSDKMLPFYWRARFAMTLFACRQMGEYITVDAIQPLYRTFQKAVETKEIDTGFFTETQMEELELLVSDVEKFCKLQIGNIKWNQYLNRSKRKPGFLKKMIYHMKAYGMKMTKDKLLGRM